MRYRVPQNIDMEDKIIGPLTMAQFVFVLIGGMIVYIDFVTLGTSLPFLFWMTAIPLGLVTLAFGFGKVQDQPFPKFLASVLLYLVKPKSRIWQKDPAMNHLNVVSKTPTTPEEASIPGELPQRHEVADLASVLDTRTESRGPSHEVRDASNVEIRMSKSLPVRQAGEAISKPESTNSKPASPAEESAYKSAPPLDVMTKPDTGSSTADPNLVPRTSNLDKSGPL